MADSKPTSKSQEAVSLARGLIENIEAAQVPTDALVLTAARLADLAGTIDEQQWLYCEKFGYFTDSPALPYMNYTKRWINAAKQLAHWGSISDIEAELKSKTFQLHALRVPDINYSVSSSPWPCVHYQPSATRSIDKSAHVTGLSS